MQRLRFTVRSACPSTPSNHHCTGNSGIAVVRRDMMRCWIVTLLGLTALCHATSDAVNPFNAFKALNKYVIPMGKHISTERLQSCTRCMDKCVNPEGSERWEKNRVSDLFREFAIPENYDKSQCPRLCTTWLQDEVLPNKLDDLQADLKKFMGDYLARKGRLNAAVKYMRTQTQGQQCTLEDLGLRSTHPTDAFVDQGSSIDWDALWWDSQKEDGSDSPDTSLYTTGAGGRRSSVGPSGPMSYDGPASRGLCIDTVTAHVKNERKRQQLIKGCEAVSFPDFNFNPRLIFDRFFKPDQGQRPNGRGVVPKPVPVMPKLRGRGLL